jgi:hypothetical protein
MWILTGLIGRSILGDFRSLLRPKAFETAEKLGSERSRPVKTEAIVKELDSPTADRR